MHFPTEFILVLNFPTDFSKQTDSQTDGLRRERIEMKRKDENRTLIMIMEKQHKIDYVRNLSHCKRSRYDG